MSLPLQQRGPILQHTQRFIIASVQKLGVLAIYPLATLTFMLMAWQGGDLETTLSDSGCDEEEEDGDGEPVVKYTTEEEYQSYISHSLPDTPLWLMDSDT